MLKLHDARLDLRDLSGECTYRQLQSLFRKCHIYSIRTGGQAIEIVANEGGDPRAIEFPSPIADERCGTLTFITLGKSVANSHVAVIVESNFFERTVLTHFFRSCRFSFSAFKSAVYKHLEIAQQDLGPDEIIPNVSNFAAR